MYRAVDTGLRAIDIRTLTEAAQSLGAGWFTILVRVILPEPARRRCCRGAFLTFAIVIGEFTMAACSTGRRSGRICSCSAPTGPTSRRPSSLIGFGLTWLAWVVIPSSAAARGRRIQVGGAR